MLDQSLKLGLIRSKSQHLCHPKIRTRSSSKAARQNSGLSQGVMGQRHRGQGQ